MTRIFPFRIEPRVSLQGPIRRTPRGERLEAAGVGFVRPTGGGHAVCIDARSVFPDMAVAHDPAWALCNALYFEGSSRGVETGSVMFGKRREAHRAFTSLAVRKACHPPAWADRSA